MSFPQICYLFPRSLSSTADGFHFPLSISSASGILGVSCPRCICGTRNSATRSSPWPVVCPRPLYNMLKTPGRSTDTGKSGCMAQAGPADEPSLLAAGPEGPHGCRHWPIESGQQFRFRKLIESNFAVSEPSIVVFSSAVFRGVCPGQRRAEPPVDSARSGRMGT